MAEKDEIILDPSVQRHAQSLARLMSIISRASKSQVEIQRKVDAYFTAVQEEMERLGISTEEAVDLVLGTISSIMAGLEKKASQRK